nr:cancer-related nucleoside-triphosphatase isoform X2 [Odocoileus virginianus texanus]
MARHVFLTGPPGVGKTTLIQKATEVLKSSGVPVDGFYTEEVRQGGRRIGFDVVTLSGIRGPLSRIGSEPLPGKRECRVGQYVVDLTSFEQLALPVLRNNGRLRIKQRTKRITLFSAPWQSCDPLSSGCEVHKHLPGVATSSQQTDSYNPKSKKQRPVLLTRAPRLAVSFLSDLRQVDPSCFLDGYKYKT